MPQINITTQIFLPIVFIFLAAYIYHFFTKRRFSKETFNAAANEFNNAFKGFRAMLENNFRYQIGRFEAPIHDHFEAAFVFRQHLGWFKRICFNRKLVKYKIATTEYDEKEQYLGVKNIPHDTNLKLIKLIDALLKYAKPK